MMEANAGLSLRSCWWIGSERDGRRNGGFLSVSRGLKEERLDRSVRLRDSRAFPRVSDRSKSIHLKVPCCCKNTGAAGSENVCASIDEAHILKRKSEDVAPYLDGRCIYLVGMMGSGKTTVGKILSEVLCYNFFDSDKLVEQAVGVSSVAQIFKEHSEAFFRDNESKVIRDLSSMRRLVVATGGGAVIRPINWRYMKRGITVWLDIPLEALARRIAAVGTASRPLLHEESDDPYTKAYMRLTTLAEQRGEAYADADARVCLLNIASKQGLADVCAVTPKSIAIEALIQIESFLNKDPTTVLRQSYLQKKNLD